MVNFLHRLGVYTFLGVFLLSLSQGAFAGVGNALSTESADTLPAVFTPMYPVVLNDPEKDYIDDATYAADARQARIFLDQRTVGNRALAMPDIYDLLVSNAADVLRDESGNSLDYPGLWFDAGLIEVNARIARYLEALLVEHAAADAVLLINEPPLTFQAVQARARALGNEQDYFAALLSDPRFAEAQRYLGEVDAAQLANAESNSDLVERWDAYFVPQMAPYLQSVQDTTRIYYPDIQFSVAGFDQDSIDSNGGVSEITPLTSLTTSVNEGFTGLCERTNQTRQLGRDAPVHWLFSERESAELIRHFNLTSVGRLVFLNGGSTEEEAQRIAMAQSDAESQLVADYAPAFDNLACEGRDYLLSVADAASGRVWRYTPDLREGESVIERIAAYSPATFVNRDITLTLPGTASEVQTSDAGVWVTQDALVALACPELSAGEYCVARFSQDGYPDQPALTEQGDLPVLVHQGSAETLLDENWRDGGPGAGVGSDEFITHWQSKLALPAGLYRFNIHADDRVRLSIDGEIVFERWQGESDARQESVERVLSGGSHDIALAYQDVSLDAAVAMSVTRLACVADHGASCVELWSDEELVGFAQLVDMDGQTGFQFDANALPEGINLQDLAMKWRFNANFERGLTEFNIVHGSGQVDIRFDNAPLYVGDGTPNQTSVQKLVNQTGQYLIEVEYALGVDGQFDFDWLLLERHLSACDSADLPNDAFCADYYANPNLAGDPVFARQETSINHTWGAGGPSENMPVNKFSARWQGMHEFTGGYYRFHADSDDGMRVWVGGQLILDNWKRQWPWGGRYRQARYIEAGEHLVQVEYQEVWGEAKAKFWWEVIPDCNTVPTGSFCGEYFPNRDLDGDPKDLANTPVIDFDWNNEQPTDAIWRDKFSVRWLGDFEFAAGGYEFIARADDGIRVWVDDQLIIDRWKYKKAEYHAIVNLPAGTHRIKVEYFEAGGPANVDLMWRSESACDQIEDGRFCVSYANTDNGELAPVAIAQTPTIKFDWGNQSPVPGVVRQDRFEADWKGYVNFESGMYRFIAEVDDEMEVRLNGEPLFSFSKAEPHYGDYFKLHPIQAGRHLLEVKYAEHWGNAKAALHWEKSADCSDIPKDQFCVSYFNNMELQGDPADMVMMDAIAMEVGKSSPSEGVKKDQFSTLYQGRFDFEEGVYRFDLGMDDSMRIFVDDNLVIDTKYTWSNKGKHQQLVPMSAGERVIRVEHVENWGEAKASLNWELVPDCSVTPSGQFCAQYYANKGLDGDPVDVRYDQAIDFDWAQGSPSLSVPGNNFSARWAGNFEFDEGLHRFRVVTDGGVRVWIDGELVLDQWRHHSNPTEYRAVRRLPVGAHHIHIEYFEAWGDAEIQFDWGAVTDCRSQIPDNTFCAEYFANPSLAGEPADVRLESDIQFNWGSTGRPVGLPADKFSVRWQGDIHFEPGVYRLIERSDDGGRVWLDGDLIIDEWKRQEAKSYRVDRFLSGVHRLKMEYYEWTGNAEARLIRRPLIVGKPDAPQDLTVKEVSQSHVSLAWKQDKHASGYHIYRNGERIAEVVSPAFIDQQVIVLGAYQYQVRTVWPDGTASDSSAVEAVIPDAEAPSSPADLNAQVMNDAVQLAWRPASDNVAVSIYQVMRNGQLLVEVTDSAYRDTGIDVATQYNYAVVARDTAGNASLPSHSITVLSKDNIAPDTPSTPEADQVGTDHVVLTWEPSQDNLQLAHYVILRDGVEIDTVNVTRYEDRGLADNQTYHYQIVAVDQAGNRSGAGAELSVQTGDGIAPTSPDNLQVERQGDQSVRLTWSAASDNVGVAGYRVLRDGRLLATALLTEFIDHSVESGNNYVYTVRAQDARGNLSDESNAAEAILNDVCSADQQYFRVSLEPELQQCSSCHSAAGGAQNTRFILTSGPNASERNMVALQNIAALLGDQVVLDKSIGVVNHGGGAPFVDADSAGYQALDAFFRRLNDPASCGEVSPGNDLSTDALVMNCYSCHGPDGDSAGPAMPSIAGMEAAYFAKTMRDYRDGVRYSTIMGRVARGYSDEQFGLMAEHFAALPYQGVEQAVDVSLASEGEELHNQYCAGCHQNQGRSLSTAGVYLAGQWKPYLAATLKDYVHRGGIAPTLMQNALDTLHQASGDQALAALAEFYAGQGTDLQTPETPESPELAATLEDGITLTWMDGDDDWGVAYYEIYRNGELIGSTEWNTFTDLGLALGIYHYEIVAVDHAGNRSEVSEGLSVELARQNIVSDAMQLLDEQQTLRKASLILLGRMPTEQEVGSVDSEETLRDTLRQMMDGDALQDFVHRAGYETFLSKGARGVDRNEGFSERDFPAITELSNADRRDLSWAVRHQPVALLDYIVSHDRDWREIVTADYAMVNPVMAQVTGAELIESDFTEDNPYEMRPARMPSVSARFPEKAYPHAGVLSTTAWLSRFPTTDTNRNRHRVNQVHMQFLGQDIEALGQRPLDDSANGNFHVPTMENPNCTSCHQGMDPMAGGFMNWGDNNRYQQNHNGESGDQDALDAAYKGNDYPPDHAGYPWYQTGDRWYRDMFSPGYGDKIAPGGHRGLSSDATRITDNLLANSGAESGTEGWAIVEGELRALPEQACDAELVPESHIGDHFFMVGGCDTRVSSVYQEVDLTPYQAEIAQNQVQVEYGAFMRNAVAWRDRPFVYIAFMDTNGAMIAETKRLTHRKPDWRFNRETVDVPANATTLRFYLRGQRSGRGQLDAYVDGATVKLILPNPSSDSGVRDNLQWLAGELAQDPRFAKGAVHFWYKALFKRKPLESPLNPDEPGYAAALMAFNEQDALFDSITGDFIQNNGRGSYNVKDLLVEFVVNPLFRVANNQGLGTDANARYADWGIHRLLTPEELNHKLNALTGASWRDFDSGRVWNSSMGVFYGGFDGGVLHTKPNREMNSLMNAIPDRIFMELSCNMVRNDFRRNSDQRLLFPKVAAADTPLVNDNLQDMHNLLVNPGAEQGMLGWNIERGMVREWSNDYLGHANGGCRGPGSAAGDYYFSVGGICNQQTEEAIAYQEVDVSQHTEAIDSGDAQAFFGANLRPWSRDNDRVAIHLVFLNAAGGVISNSHPLTHNGSSWRGVNSYMAIPAQTRRIRFVMTGQRLSGVNNDAYVDDTVLAVLASSDQWVMHGEQRIRQNLQYLHQHLLGESLDQNDPEIDRSYDLFREVWNDRENVVTGLSCNLNNNTEDPLYTKRAWAAVMVYLLSDVRFLYE